MIVSGVRGGSGKWMAEEQSGTGRFAEKTGRTWSGHVPHGIGTEEAIPTIKRQINRQIAEGIAKAARKMGGGTVFEFEM
ncbi:MAG: hypothetical protein DRP56_04825 [Planctomycetota bacterium]|nr:MAG: hypothetical protein DRP56_04825 [Planctomycetota bacterium]